MASPDNIAKYYSENLIFWSTKKLINMLEDELLKEDSHASMFAELLVRWYFNRQSGAVTDYLSQKLSKESFLQFKTWCANSTPLQKPSQLFLFPQNDDKDSSNREFLQKVQINALRRFENLFGNCDGIVPIIRQEPDGDKCGCAIPFRLEPANDSDSCVIDLDDKSIPEWSDSVSELISELNLPRFCVRLLFYSSVERYLKYAGESLQFPVLMAYWRQNELLPKYNPFAVIATGKFQDKRLAPVRLEEKIEGLNDLFEKFIFFCPDSGNTGYNESVPILAGTSVDEVLSICNKQFFSRKRDFGLFRSGIKYIVKRLETLTNSVKKDSENSWDIIINNLQQFLDELDEDQYPEHYLSALLSLSFAYCHSAKTAKAHEYNRKAVEFAKRVKNVFDLDLHYELLLLAIEEMVLLQDEENFEQILKLASEIKEQLDELDENNEKTFDLKMRYYGTLGQAHMFGTICQMEGFDKDTALECISKAIRNATNYNNCTREDNIDEVIRDMNYRHLWYALFEPGSEDEQKYHNLAVKETIVKQSPGKLKDNNLNFQFRQKCLSAYRQILLSCDNPNTACADEPIPVPTNIDSWLEALIYKYQAAVLAFCHRETEVREKFDKSIALLENIKDPLVQYVAMTVAAEAYRSFSVLGDAQTAEQYREKALNLFKANKGFELYQTADSWKEFLNTPWDKFQASGEDFPGLHYHY